jgi:hypothetical protein
MSASRRAAGADDNIFAKLDRGGARGLSRKGWSNVRIAWFGLAGLAIIGLIGVLAALARENMAAHRQPLVVEARTAPDPVATDSGFAPLPATSTPPLQLAAAANDDPATRTMVKAADQAPLPPLVKLKPAAPAPAKPAPPPPAARSTAPKPAVASAAPKPVPRLAAAAARPPAAAAPRPKKAAPAAQPRQEPAVDSDVALLSAIIMQASRHAAERAQQEAQSGAGKKSEAKATD